MLCSYAHATILWHWRTESEVTEGAAKRNTILMLFMLILFYIRGCLPHGLSAKQEVDRVSTPSTQLPMYFQQAGKSLVYSEVNLLMLTKAWYIEDTRFIFKSKNRQKQILFKVMHSGIFFSKSCWLHYIIYNIGRYFISSSLSSYRAQLQYIKITNIGKSPISLKIFLIYMISSNSRILFEFLGHTFSTEAEMLYLETNGFQQLKCSFFIPLDIYEQLGRHECCRKHRNLVDTTTFQ